MKAIIYKPTRSVMQYCDGNATDWVLEYIKSDRSIDKPTGWISTKDTQSQVHIKFPTKETAIMFAQKNKIDYEVIEPHNPTLKPNIYANNFK